jgi:(2Fe-2S) ferredoxin
MPGAISQLAVGARRNGNRSLKSVGPSGSSRSLRFSAFLLLNGADGISGMPSSRLRRGRQRTHRDRPLTSGSACPTLTSLQRKRYLFVCINRRAEDNPKGCCAAKDSEEVYRALKEVVAARGLARLEARVCTSSCLDQCATGVTVLVEPDHFFYGRVTVADVPEIVDGLVKGQPVKRLLLTAEHL